MVCLTYIEHVDLFCTLFHTDLPFSSSAYGQQERLFTVKDHWLIAYHCKAPVPSIFLALIRIFQVYTCFLSSLQMEDGSRSHVYCSSQ